MFLSQKLFNNNFEGDVEGFGSDFQQCVNNDSVQKIFNNNNGLIEVLKEIVGLEVIFLVRGNEINVREIFLGRINDCYK